MQNLVLTFFRRVGKTHILKLNGFGKPLQRNRVRALLHVVLSVEECEDGSRCAHRLLEAVVERCELAHRIVEREKQDIERDKVADCHAVVLDFVATHQQQQRDGNITDGIHQRRTDGLNAHAAHIRTEQPAGCPLEAQNLPKLRIKGLHNPVSGDRFMEDILYLGQLVLPRSGPGAHFPADFARRRNNDRNKKQKRPTEMSAVSDNKHQAKQEGEELLQKITNDRADGILHPIHIVDQSGKDCARGMLVKETGRPAQRSLIEVVAHIGNETKTGVVHQVGAHIVAQALD